MVAEPKREKRGNLRKRKQLTSVLAEPAPSLHLNLQKRRPRTISDISFDLEEGNRIRATGLLPKAKYVQATSTISQRLAETFAKNADPHPTLPTGRSGLKDLVPDYVKMFSQVFSDEGFAKVPNQSHGIMP